MESHFWSAWDFDSRKINIPQKLEPISACKIVLLVTYLKKYVVLLNCLLINIIYQHNQIGGIILSCISLCLIGSAKYFRCVTRDFYLQRTCADIFRCRDFFAFIFWGTDGWNLHVDTSLFFKGKSVASVYNFLQYYYVNRVCLNF